jgi:branched-chain amino acid aminotransferase
MLNPEGFVAECTADNVFVVKDRTVVTPPATDGALDGITAAVVRELVAAAGLDFAERRLARYDLFTADECFLTGTGAEMVPVVDLDGRRIGDGRPGAITHELTSAFRALARSEGEPVF